jgi:DNA-binding response OmpR family regulator
MVRSLRSESHIVVTDARPKDYRDLSLLAGEYGWHVHFLTSGRAAIQFARPNCADLWMVNVCLPEMSGFDLLEILRDRAAGAPVFLVADHYDSEEERRACGCGAALYLCKDSNRSIDCKRLLELLIAESRVGELPYPVISQAED